MVSGSLELTCNLLTGCESSLAFGSVMPFFGIEVRFFRKRQANLRQIFSRFRRKHFNSTCIEKHCTRPLWQAFRLRTCQSHYQLSSPYNYPQSMICLAFLKLLVNFYFGTDCNQFAFFSEIAVLKCSFLCCSEIYYKTSKCSFLCLLPV